MSIEGMALAWTQLEPGIREFYGRTEDQLRARRPLGGADFDGIASFADEIAIKSAQIRAEAESSLAEKGGDYERAAELLLAASTVDALLAADLASLDPDGELDAEALKTEGGGRAEKIRRLQRIHRDGVEGRPGQSEIVAEGQELIALVAALFAEELDDDGLRRIEGGAPRPRSRPALIGDACDGIDELVSLAHSPGRVLVEGFWSAAGLGIGHVLPVHELLQAMAELQPQLAAALRPASKLLREHVLKIAALWPEGWLADEAASAIVNHISVIQILERGADSAWSKAHARTRIEEAPEITWRATDGLRTDLEKLIDNYKKHMKWTRRSAKVLRFGAAPLSGVAVAALAAPGWLIMPSVFALGTGYVTYSLADRLDARDLRIADRVEGVTRLVDRHIPAP